MVPLSKLVYLMIKGKKSNLGPESSAAVEVVALRGDQNGDEGHDWTPEEFNLKIERERKVNRSLLSGNAFLKLKEGIGLVDKISFTNISDWMSKRPFRLGARIVDNLNGTRVIEAKSEPFTLEDCRNKLYEKHYPPSLSDEVWRLKNIDKRGRPVKRLKDENIRTVKEFLTEYFINHKRLRDILLPGMSDKKLDSTVEHALTCELNDRYLYYNPGSQQKTGVVFNVVRQVVGVLSEYQYVPINNLSKTEKADAQKSVISAFEHWGEVVPYDENSRLPNALSPPNSLRLQGHSGPDVGTSHVNAGISSNNSIGASHTIVGYDPTQPSTSSPGIILSSNSIGTSPRVAGYDPMQPSTSSPGFLPSNNSIGTSPRVAGYDPMQTSTSTPGFLPSNNSIGTSHRIATFDPTQPSTSSPGILSTNNSIGTSQMTAAYDHTLPGTSSPEIFLSGNSTGRTSSMNDIGWLNICGMEFHYDPSGALGQVPNHQMFDPVSLIQDFEIDEQLWFPNNNCNLQAMTPRAESPADQQTAENGFLLVGAQAVAIDNPRRRRWFKAHIVLKFSDHVRKKQRVH